MANPTSNSLAPASAVQTQNVQFKTAAKNRASRIFLIGTFNPALTGVVPNVPVLILNSNDASNQFGPGWPLHRMALYAEKTAGAIETWCIPQSEAGGAVAAAGTITVTVTTAESGTIPLYINGEYVPVAVSAGQTDAQIATAIAAAVTADVDLPFAAAAVTTVATLTSKGKGTYGNYCTIETALGKGEEIPGGVTLAIVQPTSGATDPDIQDALDGMGVGSNQNSEDWTHGVMTYAPITATLDAVSIYNGVGDTATGNYAPLVAKPFNMFIANNVAGSAGFTAMKAISDVRKLDRTHSYAAIPDSKSHPAEFSAMAMGIIAVMAESNPAENYSGQPTQSETGDTDRWTDEYSDRDLALKSGIATTVYKNGVLQLDKMVTFYRPDNVAPKSNGYRDVRNCALIGNIIGNLRDNFDQPKWQGVTIVADVSKVTGTESLKVRDIQSFKNDLNGAADNFESKSWIFNSDYTKKYLTVGLRALSNGFDYVFPVQLSGQADIKSGIVQFDISLTAE